MIFLYQISETQLTKLETSKRGWKRKTGWSFFLRQVTNIPFEKSEVVAFLKN